MPWLIPIGMAVAGGVAGAMSKKETSTSTVQMPDSSPLSQYLYGGKQQTSAINPEFKAMLQKSRFDPSLAGASDEDLLNWWSQNSDKIKSSGAGDMADATGGDVETFKQLKDYAHGHKQVSTSQSKDFGQGRIFGDLKALEDMSLAWSGDAGALGRNSEIANARSANTKLGEMLTAMRESGGLPTQADITAGEDVAGKLFQGQRTRMDQQFSDMTTQYSQRAAGMGRDAMDPILMAKMNQEKARMAGTLSADQGAAATNVSMQMPGQRLSYQQMFTDLQGGLAQQAWNNRAAILGMGMQVGGAERGWASAQAGRTTVGESGGGVGGAITGGMAGFGAGMGMMGGMGGGGGGGGGMGGFATGSMGELGHIMQNSPEVNTYSPVSSGGMRGIGSIGGGNWRGGRTVPSSASFSQINNMGKRYY